MAAATVTGNVDDGCCGKDGPVLSMMNKRLRALKKKLNRILQLEEAKEKGKAINKEQEDVLKSKLQVCALIEEYDRLRLPLMVAVREEIAEKEKEWLAAKEEQNLSEDKDGVSNESLEAGTESEDVSNGNLENVEAEDAAAAASAGTTGGAASTENTEKIEVLADSSTSSVAGSDETLMDMIQLLYFALLFDVRPHEAQSFMRTIKFHERVSCLSYDLVTDDSTSHLTEADLDALAAFASLITSRPPNATLSHRDALQTCVAHARNWLQSSDALIDSETLNLTYAELRERLNRILATEYFTMRPELQTVTSEIPPAHYGGEQADPQEHYMNGDSCPTSAENVSDSSGTNAEISQQPDELPKSSPPNESHPSQEQERQADENRGNRPRQNFQHYVQKFRTNRGGGASGGNANYGRGRGRRGRGGIGSGGNAGGNAGYSSNGNYGNRGGQYYDQTGYYARGSYYGNRRGRGYYSNTNNATSANQVDGEVAST